MPKELCACRKDLGKDKQMVITIKTCYKKHPGKEDLVSVSFRDVPNKGETGTNENEEEKKEGKEVIQAKVIETQPEPSPTEQPYESNYKPNQPTTTPEIPPDDDQKPARTQSELVQTESTNPASLGLSTELAQIDYEAIPAQTQLEPSDVPSGRPLSSHVKFAPKVAESNQIGQEDPKFEPKSSEEEVIALEEDPKRKSNVLGQEDLKVEPKRSEEGLVPKVIGLDEDPKKISNVLGQEDSKLEYKRSEDEVIALDEDPKKKSNLLRQEDPELQPKRSEEELAPKVLGREELRPVADRKEEYHEDVQLIKNLKQPGPSKKQDEDPKNLKKLPVIPKRYHGPGCALEINLLEKHGQYCNYRKGPNADRDPIDDRNGSYEALGRMTFRTCSPQNEPMVLFYSFVDRLRESLDDDGTTLQLDEEDDFSILEELMGRQTMWDSLTENPKNFDMGKRGLNTKCEDCNERCACKGGCSCKSIEELYVRRSSRDESTQTRTVIVRARRGWSWRWRRFLLPCVGSIN